MKITDDMSGRWDDEGRLRQLSHHHSPFRSRDSQEDPIQLAVAYLRETADLFGLDQESGFGADVLARATVQPDRRQMSDDGLQLRVVGVTQLPGSIVVGVAQTLYGVPVWRAGLTVRMKQNPLRVTGATNTTRTRMRVEKPNPDGAWMPAQLDGQVLQTFFEDRMVPALPEEFRAQYHQFVHGIQLNDARLHVYEYRENERLNHEHRDRKNPNVFRAGKLRVELPPVADRVREGAFYVVVEVLFTATVEALGPVNARMFVEPDTGSILHFSLLYAHVDGLVYKRDPVTKAGAGPTPTSPAPVLDGFRDAVTLPGLTPSGPQALAGEYVQLAETEDPVVAAPTSTGNFDYTVPSNDFSAVGAYYHSDALFRMVAAFGFLISDYFDGTAANPGFPVPVDHRGMASPFCCDGGNCVNAKAPGNSTGDGSGGFVFALAQTDTLVGITTSVRVVLHEFGHAILWDHVDSPNFGFAHSCGDSLAAILLDPATNAPDRFVTFPWVGIGRRHDRRDLAAGWAWGGTQDQGGYDSEQILSTSLFRAYQCLGGDSPVLQVREFTARYVAYLIIYAVGQLTPSTNSSDPADFVDQLMSADKDTAPFEGIPGGWTHKVLRWAFEKQGLYQPAGTIGPFAKEGDPPNVDVYIDDGRGGEYAPFLNNFWNTSVIYNRLAPNGDVDQTHQTPIVGQTNYAYVKVKNRGTQAASGVTVRGFHCKPMAGLVWPNDWQPMTTASISMPGTIGPGDSEEKIFGPFEWQPTNIGHECMLMIVDATDDASNTTTVEEPIAHWRLVPFDNNIAQRNVAPVAGGGGSSGLAASFRGRKFWVRNPFQHEARIRVETHVPKFLSERDWRISTAGVSDEGFGLDAGQERQLEFEMFPGANFTIADVEGTGGVPEITVEVYADNVLIGGMSYTVDPRLARPPVEVAEPKGPCDKPGFWNWLLCLLQRIKAWIQSLIG